MRLGIAFEFYDDLDLDCITVRDLSFNELFGDIPFSISKLKQLETL